jgi:anoctamin-8
VRAHDSTKRTAFYVSAPTNILFKAAEEYRLPKRLRADLGGALRDFTTRESHCFEQIKDDDGKIALFTSQERQWLVFQVLQGLRATSSDAPVFQGRAKVEEGQSIVAAWQDSGLIEQVFPLHETNALSQLKTSWVRKFFAPQPLGKLLDTAGRKMKLYHRFYYFRRHCIILWSESCAIFCMAWSLHMCTVRASYFRNVAMGGSLRSRSGT